MTLFFTLNQDIYAAPYSPQALMQKAEKCAYRLYRSKAKKKYRHNWERCLKNYEKVYKSFPKTDEAVRAMFYAAKAWTYLYRYSARHSDLEKAISLYRKIVEKHEGHNLADDAQYKLGEIFYTYKKDIKQAYVEFLKVEIKFPDGDARFKSSKMMDKLELILGKQKAAREKAKAVRSTREKLASVKDIRHWSTPTYTRVVIDVEAPVSYEKRLLDRDSSRKKPIRLFVDLQNAWISKDIESLIPIKDGLLRRARAAQFNKKTVRVVLDIDNMEGYKIFHLNDPFRIVVDVQGRERELVSQPQTVPEESHEMPVEERGTTLRKEEAISLAKQLGLGIRRIVIDAGHGGRDPGAIGRNGLKEKHVVLKLSNFLAQEIKERLHCQVVLTRASDEFLELERRTAIANMKKGDLFISLHTNANRYRSVQGIETYFLNVALDEHSMNLAAKENATSTKNISDLQVILNDLMLNTKIFESSRLAKFVHKGLLGELRKGYKVVRDNGVRQAPFYVLIGAEMPAILVEIGYITNSVENRRLKSDTYLKRVASGIVEGFDSYIKSMDLQYKGG